MNFKISKKNFYDALQTAARAISPNSPVPALSGLLIQAEEGKLVITGSDADISIRLVLSNEDDKDLGLSIMEEGAVVIDSRYLLEIVRKIESAEINVEIIDGTLTRISAGKVEFKINGYRPEDYPGIDFNEPQNQFQIKTSEFTEMIDETSFAANTKDTRLILTGVNLKSDGEHLICTATDSYRLARKTLDMNLTQFNVTIPAKSINSVRSVFTNPEANLKVCLDDKKVMFTNGKIIMNSKILDGSFPDTDRLIPTEFSYSLLINRRALIAAVDISSFIRNDNMMIVRMQLNSAEDITISNKSQEIGEYHQELIAEKYEGEPLDISFSGTYVIEAARTMTEDNVLIKFTGDMKPFIITSENGDDSLLQLVLPVRTYN